ncbi:hypothetical protein K435DRAFT_794547 [Dendrothele bispora CBS 962.96]|uniref:Uncharacterized protein n=1 Tax=Dendrothele bispora (strain CBS 962.96) TaxID=1314807 RepID=A0A4S8MBS2_DENBC|nr:hypothetical protein K435DRAFT_794547 [Dendrothele bispora CBS 962.96]
MSDHSSQHHPTPSRRYVPNLDLIPAPSQNLPELNQWYSYRADGLSTAMDSGSTLNTQSVYRFLFPQENLYGYQTPPGLIPTQCLPPHKSADEILQSQPLSSNAVEETAFVIQGQGHDEGFSDVISNFGQSPYGSNGLNLIRKAGGHGRQPLSWHFTKQITHLPIGDMTSTHVDSDFQTTKLSKHSKPTRVATEATLKASRRRRKNQTRRGHGYLELNCGFSLKAIKIHIKE